MVNALARRSSSLLRPVRAATSKSSTFSTSALVCAEGVSPTEMTSSVQQSTTSEGQQGHHKSLSARPSRRGGSVLPAYEIWKRTQGKAFEETPRGKGPFWLGPTPFPLNPSFVPDAPVAHSVRESMWKLHQADPQRNSVRLLSGRFGIPMERVVAILRLMALEGEFKKEGQALQMPFQQQMERLLGADEKGNRAARELEALAAGESGDVRGTVYEELGPGIGETEKPSVVAEALQQEATERSTRIRRMGSGGPSMVGGKVSITEVSVNRRTSSSSSSSKAASMLTFVDLSNRPESYAGASKLPQNVKRAAQRAANKARRRDRDAEWTRRYELARQIEAGDRSPEIIAEKRALDERKAQAEAARLQQRLKTFKSNSKFKRAMKAERDRRSVLGQKKE